MGGGAFLQIEGYGKSTLNITRLSHSQYVHLVEVYTHKLRGYFSEGEVHCPAPTPEKETHGDIDLIVASQADVNFLDMADTLGATAIILRSSLKVTLGVLKDGSKAMTKVVIYKPCSTANKTQRTISVTKEEYAQIDIELVPLDLFEWHSFYASYGGMAGLLGHIIHNLSFTISDTGLWLRLKELEESKKAGLANIADKDGRLHLSHDPAQVMQFLGVSKERYDAGFASLDELYSWLGQCRMLSVETIKLERDRAHEQRREQSRPVFSRFFEEWLPTHLPGTSLPEHSQDGGRDGGTELEVPSLDVHMLSDQYAKAAIVYFAKQSEYEVMQSRLVRIIDNATAANLLKPIIAQHSLRAGKQLNEILRAFRRYVGVVEDGQLSILTASHDDEASELHRLLASDKRSLRDETAASAWVRDHWEEVRASERQQKR